MWKSPSSGIRYVLPLYLAEKSRKNAPMSSHARSLSLATRSVTSSRTPPFHQKDSRSSRFEQVGLSRRESFQLGHHLVEVLSHGLCRLDWIPQLKCGENGAMLAKRILVAARRRQKQAAGPLELSPRGL